MRSMMASSTRSFLIRCAKHFVSDQYRNLFEISELAKKHRCSYFQSDDINSDEVQNFIKERAPDVLVSCLLLQRVESLVLGLPEIGSINFHPALVQEHRGTFASFWALFFDRRHAGATVHWMTEKFDDGAVILQQRFNVQRADSLYSLDEKTARLGGNLLVRALMKLEKKKSAALRVPLAKLFTMPAKKHTREFKTSGKKVSSFRDFFKI